jgi:hypothetical protein
MFMGGGGEIINSFYVGCGKQYCRGKIHLKKVKYHI